MRMIAMMMVVFTVCGAAMAEDAKFTGASKPWGGGDLYSFTCDGKAATVVVPKKAAEGNPWLWRGEFFGAFATVDEALVKQGWHVAYLGCSNTFGSPETMKHWEVFYKELTEKHGLSKKPVLLGMSRGGMYVYNWAALHPEAVGMIYGDAAVCDAKSWPGGKGKGKGSPGDWKLYKQIYGFKSDDEAIAAKVSPIDELEPIAKAGIPIIHVAGDADDVVPLPENTMIIKERYEKLGGHVELIIKKGVGHHPHSLADPTPIVDYILKNRLK